MKKNFLITGMLCAAFFCMTACSGTDHDPFPEENNTGNSNNTNEEEEDYVDPGDDTLVTNSQVLSLDNMVEIDFSSSTFSNPFEGNGVTISNNNGHVVITSTITDKELNYVLSGITNNGSVKIYGEYKFGLVLNGVGITNPKGAAINIQCGKKITVTVVDKTNNRLIDSENYEMIDGEDMKGTFFSEGQLNFYGNGSLEIRGKYKHAICTDDYFRIYEGNIWIKEAASDAIHAKDYTKIEGGTLTTVSNGEGIDCDGYIEINAGTLDILTLNQKGHGIKSGEYISIQGENTSIVASVRGIASKCINATGDVTISSGTLNLKTSGNAYYDTDDQDTSSSAAIKCDGNLFIDGGSITIKSTGSGGKGINVDGTLTINNGTVSVTTTGGQYVYDRNNDTAAKAIKSDGNLTVNGGSIVISTSGVEAEGLESKATLKITGGTVEIEAYDDCINASNHIEINGGNVYCKSTVNDAIDSNGTLTITGGVIITAGASSPEAGFDCDQSRFSITGGVIIGIGGDTSSPTSSACTQYSVIYKGMSANTQIVHIETTSEGSEVLTFQLPKTYNSSSTLLFSSPLLKSNTGYTIYTGGSISGGTNFHGYYTGATYNKGSSATTFTTSSMVTSIGSMGGGPGGRP
ncbi:carbohydrate-binding domain-containing protein [Bacteroides sp. 224]|uniref:carbohydrate-binding domain-containing protein n=1 Tax=Bacteroides sp. 224 TaxID=2302936 RepID=UPI001EF3471D|nr:carbohydrate-binding domain-containing protein [Bacteroides sp. 224]